MARSKSFEDMDLPAVAIYARWVLGLILIYILLIVTNVIFVMNAGPLGAASDLVAWAIVGVYALHVVASIVLGVLLMNSMRYAVTSIVAWSILMGLLNVLVLLTIYSQASTILKVLGIRSGFFGVSAANRERLKPGRCRQCGYDRSGLDDMLAPCPECNRVPIVW